MRTRILLLVAILLVPVLSILVAGGGKPVADALPIVVILLTAGLGVAWLVVRAVVQRHPLNRIVRLMKLQKFDEACALGLRLLAKDPSNPLLRLNTVSAHLAAGKRDAARELFAGLDREKLPGEVIPVFERIRSRLQQPR